MTIRKASFQTANTEPAEDLRLSLTGNLLGTTGVASAASMAVTATGTPDMNVHIAPGGALVPGSQTSTQGVYGVYVDASITAAIATANATNPRIDRICLLVDDQGGGYGAPTGAGATTANAAQVVVITGTAAPSPVIPAAPQNSITLASVAVAALASSITNGNITDLRQPCTGLGGIGLTTSARSALGAIVNGNAEWQTDAYKLLIATTATTGKVPPWNMGWGIQVAPTSVTVAQTGITAVADLTGFTLTFTAVANRRYMLVGKVRCVLNTTAAVPEVYITDNSNTVLNRASWSLAAASAAMFDVVAFVSPAAGSQTYKMRATTGAGTLDTQVSATQPGLFWVVDMGPTANPA